MANASVSSMAEKRTDEKAASPPGPEAELLKIDDDPEEALQRLLHAPRHPKKEAPC